MVDELFTKRKGLVVHEVVGKLQARIDGHELETALQGAGPPPPYMDSLCTQHMVRCQKEPWSQEPEEGLKPSLAMPEEHLRFDCGELHQVVPESWSCKPVLLEEGLVAWIRSCKVPSNILLFVTKAKPLCNLTTEALNTATSRQDQNTRNHRLVMPDLTRGLWRDVYWCSA